MRIEFKEDAPFLIERMLMYCYTIKWPDTSMETEKQWVSRFDTIVSMYALGDKFALKGLKQEAGERFTDYLYEPSPHFLQYNREFIAVIHLIYATTPESDRGLRDRAVKYGSENWGMLWGQPAFKNGLTGIGEFINDVVSWSQSHQSRYSPW